MNNIFFKDLNSIMNWNREKIFEEKRGSVGYMINFMNLKRNPYIQNTLKMFHVTFVI